MLGLTKEGVSPVKHTYCSKFNNSTDLLICFASARELG